MRNIITTIVLLILCAGLWLYGLGRFVGALPHTVTDQHTPTDAIVILTGGSERISSAIDLLNKELSEALFISGVGKDATIETILLESSPSLPDNIAALMPRITLGYEALDTQGNALETAAWIRDNNYKSVRLVTANYHLPRSLLEFKHTLGDIIIIPHPVFSGNVILKRWWTYPGTRKLLISEYNKYIATWLRSLL